MRRSRRGEAFLDAVEAGGVAVMELIARELKAMGLYVARALSFDGVEYEALRHPLTQDDTAIWDAWADAFLLIPPEPARCPGRRRRQRGRQAEVGPGRHRPPTRPSKGRSCGSSAIFSRG